MSSKHDALGETEVLLPGRGHVVHHDFGWTSALLTLRALPEQQMQMKMTRELEERWANRVAIIYRKCATICVSVWLLTTNLTELHPM